MSFRGRMNMMSLGVRIVQAKSHAMQGLWKNGDGATFVWFLKHSLYSDTSDLFGFVAP